MKNLTLLLTFIGLVFSSSQSLASKKTSEKYGVQVAESASKLLKSGKNLKGFMKTLNGHFSPRDINMAKKLLLSKDVSMKSKIPNFSVKGSKVIFDQENYIDFVSPDLVVFNGIKLRRSQKDLHESISLVLQKIEKKQKLSWFQKIFFSKAYAMNTMQGVIAALAGGAIGALTGEKYLGLDRWKGAALGVGAVYLISELIHSNRKGQVSCSVNGDFQIRQKSRNGLFMATASYNTVPEATLTAAGLPTTCTDSRAATLASFLGTGVSNSSTTESSSTESTTTESTGAIL